MKTCKKTVHKQDINENTQKDYMYTAPLYGMTEEKNDKNTQLLYAYTWKQI